MASGWANDDAVNEQINSTIEDAVARARGEIPRGESLYECEECGEVTKMECHHLAELYSHVNADHHFSINPKKTIFYGKCEKCGKCEEKNK